MSALLGGVGTQLEDPRGAVVIAPVFPRIPLVASSLTKPEAVVVIPLRPSVVAVDHASSCPPADAKLVCPSRANAGVPLISAVASVAASAISVI
jgi:hypothetical protein